MKRIFLLIFTLFTITGYSQERFFKVFDYNGELDFATCIAQEINGYLIAGSFDTTLTKRGVGIVQYNDTGGVVNVYYKKFSKVNYSSEQITYVKKFKNKFVFTGYFHESDSNPRAGFVATFSDSTKEVKILFIDIGFNDRPTRLFYPNKNKIYFGGQIIENNNAILFLAAIDTAGNLLWNKTYNAGGFHYFTSLEPTQDGQLLVGGYVNQGSLYKNLMLKYDTLGNLLWEKKNGSANFLYTNGYSIETLNGDFVQVGIKATEPARESMGNIIRYDSNRDILFNKTYNFIKEEDQIEVFNNVIELDDESLIIGGTMRDTIKEDDPVTLLLKTDKEGNVLWRRTYSYYEDDTHTYFEDFIQTNDGGFAITGYVIPPPAIRPLTKNDMFLLKVDEFGCLTPGCELVDVPEIKLDKVKPDLLQVYPNPVSSHLNMISTSLDQLKGNLKIYNIEGKLVLQQPFTNQLDVANLPKGQYVISYWEDYEFVDSEVFIKE